MEKNFISIAEVLSQTYAFLKENFKTERIDFNEPIKIEVARDTSDTHRTARGYFVYSGADFFTIKNTYWAIASAEKQGYPADIYSGNLIALGLSEAKSVANFFEKMQQNQHPFSHTLFFGNSDGDLRITEFHPFHLKLGANLGDVSELINTSKVPCEYDSRIVSKLAESIEETIDQISL